MIPHYGDSIHMDWLELYKKVIRFQYAAQDNKELPLAKKLTDLRLHEGLDVADWSKLDNFTIVDKRKKKYGLQDLDLITEANFPVDVQYKPPKKIGASHELVELIAWLRQKYADEFANFHSRKAAEGRFGRAGRGWVNNGENWHKYTFEQWDAIAEWACACTTKLLIAIGKFSETRLQS